MYIPAGIYLKIKFVIYQESVLSTEDQIEMRIWEQR